MEVTFTVAVPLVPVDWLTCNQVEGLSIFHEELHVMVTVESAPESGKSILGAETDNWGALAAFFLHPREKAAAISMANNALKKVVFIIITV
jgi:hypothetical protein